MTNNKWKDHLLKSGLPLEYEIKKYLDSRNCISSFEYSYLRPNENSVINEFSFDIDSAYIVKQHFFKLLIECKYRDPSTNWVFIPGEYNGPSELDHMSFLHPNDHFLKSTKFPFKHPQLPVFAKACLKGIELTSEGPNPKTITQAVRQISYGLADIIVDDMVHQVERLLGNQDMIFYNIPIIITTANLYRIKENMTIDEIRQQSDVLQVATRENYIVLETKPGKELERHNMKKFTNFIKKFKRKYLNSELHSFNDDIKFVCEVIAANYCPQSMLVMQHTLDNASLASLFSLLDDIVNPSQKTKEYLKKENERIKEMSQNIKDMMGNKK